VAEGFESDHHAPLKDGKLGDLAPAILRFLELEIPSEMNGNAIF